MDSDVCITDFDSDDDDVIWPREQDPTAVDNDSRRLDENDVATSRRSWQARRVREFGEHVDNSYGWVQCRSRSQPGMLYFHNTRSGCNTWYRPVSRYVDIPFVSVERVNVVDDVTTSDLELMSVSDSEKGPIELSMEMSDVISRYYYVPQVDLLARSDTSDLDESADAFADECRDNDDERNDANGDDGNDRGMETEQSPFHITNFLETEFFVGDGEVNTERTRRIIKKSPTNSDDSSLTSDSPTYSEPRRVYRVPRLKRIGQREQIIKRRQRRVREDQEGFRRIVCEMYGVRTVNYDPPEPHMLERTKANAGMEMKVSRLSDSDSDDDVGDESQPRRSQQPWQLRDQDFCQPLLSDASSSTSSSSHSGSDSSSSGSNTCSTCSTCTSCTTSN